MARTIAYLCMSLLAGACSVAAEAPPPPAEGEAAQLFDRREVLSLGLTVSAADWEILQRARPQGPPRPGGPDNAAPGGGRPGGGPPPPRTAEEHTYVRADLELRDTTVKDVGLRLKGNSSLRFAAGSLKTPFKLDFNRFVKGRKFMGLASLHLNINAMDPSAMRETLAYEVFRQAGVPCSRTAHAKVYLTVPGLYDRRYLGLYALVEDIDKSFVAAHFGNGQGLLLKPERAANLPYLGDAWEAYPRLYEVKTDGNAELRERFIAFLKLVHTADDDTFRARLAECMDVDEFLRFVAVNGLTANMDSFLCTGHNFCLYLSPETRRIVWIPWDLNEAFAGFVPAGTSEEQLELSIDRPFTGANRLLERVLAVPEFARAYREHVARLMDAGFKAEALTAAIATTSRLIADALAEERAASPSGAAASENPMERFSRQKPPLDVFVRARTESVTRQLAGTSRGRVLRMEGPRGGPGGAPRRDVLLRALDTNGDGAFSAQELAGAPAALQALDRNGDGAIDGVELRLPARRDDVPPGPGDPPNVRAPEAPGDARQIGARPPSPDLLILWALDGDGDGELSARERAAATEALRRLDKNGDGAVDRNELRLPAAVRE